MKTESEWLGIFEKWEQSGLNQKAFCKLDGLKYSEFYGMRMELLSKGLIHSRQPVGLQGSLKSERFVPLSISKDSSASEPKGVADSSMMEVRLPNGIVLRIPTHVGS